MAQMREAVSAPQAPRGEKRGPVSMKGIDHLEVHPAFGGKVKVVHHYNQRGMDYKQPHEKEMEPEAAAKHISGFLGVKHEESSSGGGQGEYGGAPEGEQDDE